MKIIRTDSSYRLADASKTPLSPATDSSLTAAETLLVFPPDKLLHTPELVSLMGLRGGLLTGVSRALSMWLPLLPLYPALRTGSATSVVVGRGRQGTCLLCIICCCNCSCCWYCCCCGCGGCCWWVIAAGMGVGEGECVGGTMPPRIPTHVGFPPSVIGSCITGELGLTESSLRRACKLLWSSWPFCRDGWACGTGWCRCWRSICCSYEGGGNESKGTGS